MTTDLQTMIKQRPHLKDPLEFYAKWQRFHHEVMELLPKWRSSMSPEDSKAYPRESVRSIFNSFVSGFSLSSKDFEPLCKAIEDGAVDFMRLPLDEMPTHFFPAYNNEDLSVILFLFSRPYFLALREAHPQVDDQWQNGRCPFCSARTALASIVEGPKRLLHCSYCGTTGSFRFIGCPNCGAEDTTKLNTIVSEDEPGFRVITCDACRTYVKVLESSILQEMTVDLADIASIPLDILAQKKGYARIVPNPVSLKNME